MAQQEEPKVPIHVSKMSDAVNTEREVVSMHKAEEPIKVQAIDSLLEEVVSTSTRAPIAHDFDVTLTSQTSYGIWTEVGMNMIIPSFERFPFFRHLLRRWSGYVVCT